MSFLKDLTYDRYRMIRFKPDQAIWRADGLPFQLQFFHRGFYYANRVDIFEVKDGLAAPFVYSPSMFTFGDQPAPEVQGRQSQFSRASASTGRSTDRITSTRSAFLSARVIFARSPRDRATACRRAACRSGPPMPRVRNFRPSGPSGSNDRRKAQTRYRARAARQRERGRRLSFRHTARRDNGVRREAAMFPRVHIDRAGLAPLTSMYSPARTIRRRGRFPPGGAQLQRAGDPDRAHRAALAAVEKSRRPKGQRFRRQHRAASACCSGNEISSLRGSRGAIRSRPTPGSSHRRFGEGEVHLVEIPTRSEIHDKSRHFGARPSGRAKREYGYNYRIHCGASIAKPSPLARRRDPHRLRDKRSTRQFVVDFAGETLKACRLPTSRRRWPPTRQHQQHRGTSKSRDRRLADQLRARSRRRAGGRVRAQLERGDDALSERGATDGRLRPGRDGGGLKTFVPPEAPLAMPVQSLVSGPRAPVADCVRRDCGAGSMSSAGGPAQR